MGLVESIKPVTGYAGLRRPLTPESHLAPTGASMPPCGIITPENTLIFREIRMNYSDTFMRQHEEMCQVVSSIIFALAETGHDSPRENIVAVLRNELAEPGK